MRFTKIVRSALCTVVFMSLITGCGSRNKSTPVTEFPMPGDDVFSSLMNDPDASLMLCNDGTYKIYTPYTEDDLQLLEWEYKMSED